MSYHVYLLYSHSHERTYVGHTDELKNRVRKHNAGKVKWTKHFRPWILIYQEQYETRSEAMKRERWFKNPQGRKFIAVILLKYRSSL